MTGRSRRTPNHTTSDGINRFTARAISGAGADDVGVAGAFAANVSADFDRLSDLEDADISGPDDLIATVRDVQRGGLHSARIADGANLTVDSTDIAINVWTNAFYVSYVNVYTEDLNVVLCDQERVIQILTNLLNNASKYTPEEGYIDVAVQLAAEKGYLQITVADDGIGIPIEDQGKVFGTFFRAANVGKSGASGAGLGLAITQMLIEQHGGQIWFESAVDQGTKFHFTLPVA